MRRCPTPAPAPPFRRSIAVVIGIDSTRTAFRRCARRSTTRGASARSSATHHGYEVVALLDAEATRAAHRDAAQGGAAGAGRARRPRLPLLRRSRRGRRRARRAERLPAAGGRLARRREHLPAHAAACTRPSSPCPAGTCWSSSIRASRARSAGAAPGRSSALPEVIHQERYERFVRDPAWQVITSAVAGPGSARPAAHRHARRPRRRRRPFALRAGPVRGARGPGRRRAARRRRRPDHRHRALPLHRGPAADGDDRGRRAARRRASGRSPSTRRASSPSSCPGRELTLPPAPPLTADANPWRGLSSYDSSDAALFFGREAPTAALQEAIDGQAARGRAGRLGHRQVEPGEGRRAAAARAGLALAACCPCVRPGTTPLDALAQAVGNAGARRSAPTPDGDRARRWRAWCEDHPGERLLLVVDQCEELVTMARAASARDAVMALLARLLDAHPLQLTVVLTLRTDFEPQFDRSALGAGLERRALRRAADEPRRPEGGHRAAGLGPGALLRPAGAGRDAARRRRQHARRPAAAVVRA